MALLDVNLDITTPVRQAIGPAVPTGDTDGLRRYGAFVFSSDLRQEAYGRATVSQSTRIEKARATLNAIDNNNPFQGLLDGVRQEAAQDWLSAVNSAAEVEANSVYMRNVTMLLNPRNARFTQPKRIKKKDTRTGSVFFHFGNSRGQNNDVMKVSFSGSTGEINPEVPGAKEKLITWHNLYLLSTETMLLADGRENRYWITYRSKLLPVPVTLWGFFENVVDFTEDGTKPNSSEYSFTFIVTRTSPSDSGILSQVAQALISDTLADYESLGESATLTPGENGIIG